MFFSVSCSGAHRDLHSFPTRRSSDLSRAELESRLADIRARMVAYGIFSSPLGKILIARSELGIALVEYRSEEHTSELQSHHDLVCRLLLEKKNKKKK